MSYGLLVNNPSGYVLLDDSYPRYNVLQAGSGSALSNVYFPEQTQSPLIFIRTTDYGDSFMPVSADLNANINPGEDHFVLLGTNADLGDTFGFSYVICSRFDLETPPSGIGFNILDASSNLLFSSQGLFFNIDTITQYNLTTDPLTVTLPTPAFGQRYVAFMGPKEVKHTWSANYYYPWVRTIKTLSETQIELSTRAMPAAYYPTSISGADHTGSTFTVVSGFLYIP